MNVSLVASTAVLIVVLAASIYTDLKYAKILNKFVLPCVLIGLLIWGIGSAWPGLVFSLEGIGVGAVALVIAATVRWLAPGDAKLIVAVGALTGPYFVGSTMLYGAVAGGLIAVVIMMRKRLLRDWAAGTAVAVTAHIPVASAWSRRAGFMPYSLAIAAGALVAGFLPLW